MGKQEIALNNMVNQIEIKPYKHETKYYETDQMGVMHKWQTQIDYVNIEKIN